MNDSFNLFSSIAFLNLLHSSLFFSNATMSFHNHHEGELPWHKGEKLMHKLMHIPDGGNPNSPFLSPGAGYLLQAAPLLALGTLDEENRPWTTIWGGEPGFGRPVGRNIVGIKTLADKRYDPVVHALLKGSDDGEIVKEEGEGRMIGGMRIKLHGRMVAGALVGMDKNEKDVGNMQLIVSINKSLGKFLHPPQHENF